MEIEQIVYDEIKTQKRVSSGNKLTSEEMAEKMMGTGLFDHMLFIEGNHNETMTIERYMNIWRSVNDIQVQAGEEGFKRILDKIAERLKEYKEYIEDLPEKDTKRILKELAILEKIRAQK